MKFEELVKNKNEYIGGKIVDNYIDTNTMVCDENEIVDITADEGFLKVHYKEGDKVCHLGGVDGFAHLSGNDHYVNLSLSCGCGSFRLYKKEA